MKKLVSVVALLTVVSPAFAAAPQPKALKKTSSGYDVTYSYQDKSKSGWYGALRADLNFLSWTNKYSTDAVPLDPNEDHNDYSFEPLFGVDFAFGKRFDYFWRAEVEAGYIADFNDDGQGVEYKFSLPYLMANGYYDFTNGFYVGAGLGISFPTTTLSAPGFSDEDDRSKTGVSPMFGLMGGYSYRLDDSFLIDLRYRFAGTWGTTHERELANTFYFKNKMGFVMDNSISVGVRYEF
ncbi:MAG: porin family protein [Alphaproteobacteria bacterium]|nr:porin family protein [Alphaproteobacteria bacterium]